MVSIITAGIVLLIGALVVVVSREAGRVHLRLAETAAEAVSQLSARCEGLNAKVVELKNANEALMTQLAEASSEVEELQDILDEIEDASEGYLEEDEEGNLISPLGDTVPACPHGNPVDEVCDRCEEMVRRSVDLGEGESQWLRTNGIDW